MSESVLLINDVKIPKSKPDDDFTSVTMLMKLLMKLLTHICWADIQVNMCPKLKWTYNGTMALQL